MPTSFDGIVTQLEEELSVLRREVKLERTATAAKEGRAEQIEGALHYLKGGGTTGRAKRETSGRKCATKDDVLSAVLTILRENESVPADDLKELVYDSLRTRFDLKGAAMRLREALADERFEQTPPGVYRLAAAHPMRGTSNA